MSTVISIGEVGRILEDSFLTYVTLEEDGRTLCFSPEVLEGYKGQPLEQFGIAPNVKVSVEWDTEAEIVSQVSVGSEALAEAAARRSALPSAKDRKGADSGASGASDRAARQIELHPDEEPRGEANILSALPPETREFGKIVNTASLRPGDLMLARAIEPDDISGMIANTQRVGGYHDMDTRWSHAAIYLGDGSSILEATFNTVLRGGSVRVTNLFHYSQGDHALRFRRSRFISDDRQAWHLCIRAMTRLGKPYSFVEAAAIWINVALRKRGLYNENMRRSVDGAVICSLLYADAYSESVRRVLGEREGVCVPAWLSASDEFEDVRTDWLAISR